MPRSVVTDTKRAATSFYEKLGFVALVGVREGLLVGEPLPMLVGRRQQLE